MQPPAADLLRALEDLLGAADQAAEQAGKVLAEELPIFQISWPPGFSADHSLVAMPR